MFPEALSYHAALVSSLLDIARRHVEQLVLVSGGDWQARSALLQALASEQGLKYISIGLPLAEALLGQSPFQRPLFAVETIEKLAINPGSGIALDHIEILFDPDLHTDPLRLAQSLAHRQLILLSWPGQYQSPRLLYAEPGHPEFRAYHAGDTLIYSLENS
jgi:hypothetical protein